MMKTEVPTNGEPPPFESRDRPATATPDYEQNGSRRLDDEGGRSGKEKKRSLFRRPGVIVAAAALAIAGIGYGRLAGHVSNRFLIAASSLLMAYSCFLLGDINLQIAPGNLLWPIIISGVSASSIFVPLTTSAMGTLSQEQMGNATGIFNLVRNVGGSIGIAVITTLVTRSAQTSQAALAHQMSKFNFNFQQQFAHIQTALASTNGNWDAIKKATAVLYGILQQQSLLLSYVYGFRFCVLVCLVCAALALLFKKVGKPAGPIAVH